MYEPLVVMSHHVITEFGFVVTLHALERVSQRVTLAVTATQRDALLVNLIAIVSHAINQAKLVAHVQLPFLAIPVQFDQHTAV